MIQLGKYNQLHILRIKDPGAFLGDAEGNEVLLPKRYVPLGAKKEDELRVFIYKDSEDRPVATTRTPLLELGEFGVLKVKDVNRMGAFLEWGLEKDLLVPFREQLNRMEVGSYYLIYLYHDKDSDRLAATAKVNPYFKKDLSLLKEGQEVQLLIADSTELGINVVVDNQYRGLIYHNEVFRDVMIGERTRGYIKKVRGDTKLDIQLTPPGMARLDEGMESILSALRDAGGYLPVHDKSSPEDIQEYFELSKKNFKRSLGMLYRQRLVTLEKEGIRLNE